MNPFVVEGVRDLRGRPCAEPTAYDRLRMVPSFDAAQCHAALAVRGLQGSVRAALVRRLRRITPVADCPQRDQL